MFFEAISAAQKSAEKHVQFICSTHVKIFFRNAIIALLYLCSSFCPGILVLSAPSCLALPPVRWQLYRYGPWRVRALFLTDLESPEIQNTLSQR